MTPPNPSGASSGNSSTNRRRRAPMEVWVIGLLSRGEVRTFSPAEGRRSEPRPPKRRNQGEQVGRQLSVRFVPAMLEPARGEHADRLPKRRRDRFSSSSVAKAEIELDPVQRSTRRRRSRIDDDAGWIRGSIEVVQSGAQDLGNSRLIEYADRL